jgi:DUF2946 family protein
MDDSVIAALAKWPNVPAVFGWLALTARGEWRLRGEPIANAAIRDFIGRNYTVDEHGRWYFQNGPQRVFAELESTPWIYHRTAEGGLVAHTGVAPSRCVGTALLDGAALLLVTELGPGVVDDRDAAAVIETVSDLAGAALSAVGIERWLAGAAQAQFVPSRLCMAGEPLVIERLAASDAPARYGYSRNPQP